MKEGLFCDLFTKEFWKRSAGDHRPARHAGVIGDARQGFRKAST